MVKKGRKGWRGKDGNLICRLRLMRKGQREKGENIREERIVTKGWRRMEGKDCEGIDGEEKERK